MFSYFCLFFYKNTGVVFIKFAINTTPCCYSCIIHFHCVYYSHTLEALSHALYSRICISFARKSPAAQG